MSDWNKYALGQVLKLRNGYAFKSSDYCDDGIPLIRISDINSGLVQTEKSVKVPNDKSQNDFLIEQGDILIAMSGATTGKYGIFKEQNLALQNQRVGNFKILKSDLLDKKFLFYLIAGLKRQIEEKAYGGAQPNISSKMIEEMEVQIPSLPEQHRIVARIEELFSELDHGIERLKQAKAQLKTYRQAVLKAAFEGNWDYKKITDVCQNIKVGIVIKPTRFYSSDKNGVPAFRSANVREFRIEDSNWVHFTEDGNQENHRTQLKEGDVLIVRSGYPGTSCVVPKKFHGTNAIDILIASPDKNQIMPEFLCAFNNSPFGKGLFSSGSRGVAQKHLNVGVYSNLLIPVPSLDEQTSIIQRVESALSICDHLEKSIEAGLKQSESLRQSILKKAFEGRLV